MKKLIIAFLLLLGSCEPVLAQGNYTTGYFTSAFFAGPGIGVIPDPFNTLQLQLGNNTAGGLTWTLPGSNGTSGQVLSTNGSMPTATLLWRSIGDLGSGYFVKLFPSSPSQNIIIDSDDVSAPLTIREPFASIRTVSDQFVVEDSAKVLLDEIFPDGSFYSDATITGVNMQISSQTTPGAAIINGTTNIVSVPMSNGQLLIGTGGNPVANYLTMGPGVGGLATGGHFEIYSTADSTGIAKTTDSTHWIPNALNFNYARTTAAINIAGSIHNYANDSIGGSLFLSGRDSIGGSELIEGNDTVQGGRFTKVNDSIGGNLIVGSTFGGTMGAHSTALGVSNLASGVDAVAAGYANNATGQWSFAVGDACTASGDYSVAMGQGGSTNSKFGSFNFSDNSAATNNDANNQFMVRASGGYKLFDDATANPGLTMTSSALNAIMPETITISGVTASTTTQGLQLTNSTTATSGNPQFGPYIDWYSNAYYTGAQHQSDWKLESQVETNGDQDWVLSNQENSAGEVAVLKYHAHFYQGGGGYLALGAPSNFVNGATNLIVGNGPSAAITAINAVSITSTPSSGANAAGGQLEINGGASTGLGFGGPVSLGVSYATTNGSTSNAATQVLTITPTASTATFLFGASGINPALVLGNSTNSFTQTILGNAPSANRKDTLPVNVSGQLATLANQAVIAWMQVTVTAGVPSPPSSTNSYNIASITQVSGGTDQFTLTTTTYAPIVMFVTPTPGAGGLNQIGNGTISNLEAIVSDHTGTPLNAFASYSYYVSFMGN
jgi:hypothetical protein